MYNNIFVSYDVVKTQHATTKHEMTEVLDATKICGKKRMFTFLELDTLNFSSQNSSTGYLPITHVILPILLNFNFQ